MASSNEPAWLNQSPPPGAYSQDPQVNKGTNPDTARRIWMLNRLWTLAVSGLMGASGALGTVLITDGKVPELLVSLYVFVFALLIFLVTLRVERVDKILRPYFGFMYGQKGRTFFYLFVAFLNFGLGNDLGLACGIVMVITFAINLLLWCRFPSEESLKLGPQNQRPPAPTPTV